MLGPRIRLRFPPPTSVVGSTFIPVAPGLAGLRHAATSGLPVAMINPTRSFSAVGGIEDRHEPAAVHHADPVREFHDLVELGRDEQHGRARIALGHDLLVDELDRSDVDATRRLVGDEQREVPAELTGDDDLLLIPPDSVAAGDGARRRADVELRDQPFSAFGIAFSSMTATREGRVVVVGQDRLSSMG